MDNATNRLDRVLLSVSGRNGYGMGAQAQLHSAPELLTPVHSDHYRVLPLDAISRLDRVLLSVSGRLE